MGRDIPVANLRSLSHVCRRLDIWRNESANGWDIEMRMLQPLHFGRSIEIHIFQRLLNQSLLSIAE